MLFLSSALSLEAPWRQAGLLGRLAREEARLAREARSGGGQARSGGSGGRRPGALKKVLDRVPGQWINITNKIQDQPK